MDPTHYDICEHISSAAITSSSIPTHPLINVPFPTPIPECSIDVTSDSPENKKSAYQKINEKITVPPTHTTTTTAGARVLTGLNENIDFVNSIYEDDTSEFQSMSSSKMNIYIQARILIRQITKKNVFFCFDYMLTV